MSKKIESDTKARISEFLPDAIAQALTSYYRFARQEAPPEAKDFSAHHNACKVAIAHIELLIKLARWADLPDKDGGDQNIQAMLSAVMTEAQAEVASYKEKKQSKPQNATAECLDKSE